MAMTMTMGMTNGDAGVPKVLEEPKVRGARQPQGGREGSLPGGAGHPGEATGVND